MEILLHFICLFSKISLEKLLPLIWKKDFSLRKLKLSLQTLGPLVWDGQCDVFHRYRELSPQGCHF